ncbi:recombination factor protein RarA, partial [Providencia huaxiensis]
VLLQALADTERGLGGQNILLPDCTRKIIAQIDNGDARRSLNLLEMMADMAEADSQGQRILTADLLKEVSGERTARFDNKGDRYYDLISALHKSVRGSAPDAALYWYARIITAGGDPLYVARRLLAIASEDVGNADPRAMQVAISAWDCFTRVGPAEGERAIAQAIIYLACAP